MAEVLVKHRFVSAKPDSADGSMVSSSEWNDSEVFSGGEHGQILARDGGSSTGASYIARPVITDVGGSHTGASPSGALCTTVLTFTTSVYCMLTLTVNAVTSGSATVSVVLKEDGVDQMTVRAPGTGLTASGTRALARSAGAHTYTVVATADSGTFTSFTVQLATLTIGVI